jgi:hypothetical protein
MRYFLKNMQKYFKFSLKKMLKIFRIFGHNQEKKLLIFYFLGFVWQKLILFLAINLPKISRKGVCQTCL